MVCSKAHCRLLKGKLTHILIFLLMVSPLPHSNYFNQ